MRALSIAVPRIIAARARTVFLALTVGLLFASAAQAQASQSPSEFEQLGREIVERLRAQGFPVGERALVDTSTALGKAVAAAYPGAVRLSIGSRADAARCWTTDGVCATAGVVEVITTEVRASGDTLRAIVLVTRRSASPTARSGTVIEGEEFIAVRRGQAGFVFLRSERRITS